MPEEIRIKWVESGGQGGALGLPVGETAHHDDGQHQDFQGGSIYWSAATGAHAVFGAIRDSGWRSGTRSSVVLLREATNSHGVPGEPGG